MLRIFSFVVDVFITMLALTYAQGAHYPLYQILIAVAVLCGFNALSLVFAKKYPKFIAKHTRSILVISNYVLLVLLAVLSYTVLSVGSNGVDPTAPSGALMATGSMAFGLLTVVGNMTYAQQL